MMSWWRTPPGLSSDPRFAALTLPARGLLGSLYNAAGAGDVVPLGAMSLDAVLLAVSGRAPEADVRAAWDELLGVGLVLVETGQLVLCLARPQTPRVLDASPLPAPAPARTHTTPEGQNLRASAKRLAAIWSRYGISLPAARAAWLDTPAGAAFFRRETMRGVTLTREWALAQTRTYDENRGRFGHPQRRERSPFQTEVRRGGAK